MRRLIAGVAVAGIGASIALHAREQLARDDAAIELPAIEVTAAPVTATPVEPAAVPAPDATAAPAESASPGTPAPETAPVPIRSPSQERPESVDPGPAADATAEQDPEDILRKAAEAYAQVRTLQADFVQRLDNPLLRSTTSSRGTIYQRRPDRFLMRFSEPAGDVIVSDGRYFWIYYPSVDARQVIRLPAAAGGAGAVDLQAQFLGDPVRRFASTLHGSESVGGRAAHVLTLVPRQPLGYRSLKVWIDAGDHMARRFEITESSGAVRRFELSGLRVNGELSDALFRFTPPAGAQVIDRG